MLSIIYSFVVVAVMVYDFIHGIDSIEGDTYMIVFAIFFAAYHISDAIKNKE